MRRPARIFRNTTFFVALAAIVSGGCTENSMTGQGELNRLRQQQQAMTNRGRELDSRINGLDRNNTDLTAEVARARKQAKAAEDQLVVVRDQLRTTTAQLSDARAEKDNREKQVNALTASMRRKGGVSISPNSSLADELPRMDPNAGYARHDGDLVRVGLYSASLFEPGGTQLRPDASKLIVDTANQIRQIYPGHVVAVEGHTDRTQANSRQYGTNHELSVAQASAVYRVLTTQASFRPEQLLISGHGANYPLYSNGYARGQQQNRRIEFVIHPDTK